MPGQLNISTVGLMGFGAFGQLIAQHLRHHVRMVIHDPGAGEDCLDLGLTFGTAAEVGNCDMVILAVPVTALTEAISQLRPHLRQGAIVADVGSVKTGPARVMMEQLPSDVEILGTHPLFGPQSARNGLAGHKITLCPIRGTSFRRIAAVLRRVFGLKVFVTTPEEHDREAAVVQGVTHLIAKVLVQMEPLPRRLTTASFDHLMQAVEMVRHDAPGVFHAIERENPFAAEVRSRFFALAETLRGQLESNH
jgi:prephenate dehydrogenase